MAKNIRTRAATLWTYLAEVIVVMLLVVLATLIVGEKAITGLVDQFLVVFLGLPVFLITFSLQLRSSIVSGISGDFAGWLQYKGSDLYYLTAALYTVWCAVAIVLICPILATTRPPYWAPAILGLLGLSAIQVFNLSTTTLEIHRLKTTFEREMKKTELRDKESA